MRGTIILIMLLTLLPAIALALPTDEERLEQGAILKEIFITSPETEDKPPWAHVRVRTVINSAPDAVWAALTDIERWPKWLPMSRKAHFLSPEAAALITPEVANDHNKVLEIDFDHPSSGRQASYSGLWKRMVYEEYDLPWPIKNEWVVRNYIYNEGKEKNRASWRMVSKQADEDDGYWEVSGRPDGRTLIRYYYKAKAKEGVPKPVFKAAISLTVNSMIKALRHEAARREAVISPASHTLP